MKSVNLISWDNLSFGQEIFCVTCGQFSSQIKVMTEYEKEPTITIRCVCGAEALLYRCDTPGCDSYVLGGDGYAICRYCQSRRQNQFNQPGS